MTRQARPVDRWIDVEIGVAEGYEEAVTAAALADAWDESILSDDSSATEAQRQLLTEYSRGQTELIVAMFVVEDPDPGSGEAYSLVRQDIVVVSRRLRQKDTLTEDQARAQNYITQALGESVTLWSEEFLQTARSIALTAMHGERAISENASGTTNPMITSILDDASKVGLVTACREHLLEIEGLFDNDPVQDFGQPVVDQTRALINAVIEQAPHEATSQANPSQQ